MSTERSLKALFCAYRREQDTQRVVEALYAAALDQPHTLTSPSTDRPQQPSSSHFSSARLSQQAQDSDPEDGPLLSRSQRSAPSLPQYEQPPALPFEMRALEVLLAETAEQFERRRRRLALLSDATEDRAAHTPHDTADLHSLLPIQRWGVIAAAFLRSCFRDCVLLYTMLLRPGPTQESCTLRMATMNSLCTHLWTSCVELAQASMQQF